MSNNAIQLILVTALALVATVAVVVFWQWWREANSAKRRAVLREAARWAVLAAEHLHYGHEKAGPTKLAWALTQLHKRFPDLDDATLTQLAERMVANLNASQAADVARLNGKGPRHDG